MGTTNLITIRCTFVYEIFRGPTGWCSSRYREKDTQKVFNASGENLPNAKNVTYALTGEWKINKKDGRKQFSVLYYEIPKQTEKDGIIAFLQALKCGIGRKLANEVYEEFGENSWRVIDEYPYELTKVKGISTGIVQKLIDKQMSSSQLRNLISICYDANIQLSPTQMRSLINKFGNDTTTAINANPFVMTEVDGIPFDKADAVASALGYPNNFAPRIEAGLVEIFKSAAVRGHVCLPKAAKDKEDGVLELMQKFLGCSADDCKAAISKLWQDGKLKAANGYLFLTEMYDEEQSIADQIFRLSSAPHTVMGDVDKYIKEYEEKNFSLADSQRDAVRMVFRNQVNIITGGPGTGKTTVTKAVLYVHQKIFGTQSEPTLLAPTGKAARRMSEATEYPAQTIHSAVGYKGDGIAVDMSEMIPGNLIIVDEVSMMDQQIAAILLAKITTGAKIVMVGDPDQLPSVGAGNVLADMIRSHVVPTTKLTVIFRQKGENPIVANSHKMNEGKTDLLYTNTFKFIETNSNNETFIEACKLYFKSVKAYGINDVILLNPQRQNTDLSVAVFNKKLQELLHKHKEMLNIEKEGEFTLPINGITFMVGDKIMQLKNTDKARNGDVGFIKDICRYPDPDDPMSWIYYALVEFNEDGNVLEYSIDEMKDVDLAYCTTVHKSQGSEYKTVIEVVSKAHPNMLKRQVVYTAVTRAKVNVALIGEKDALKMAIENGEPEKRYTLLSSRLRARQVS